MLIDLHGKTGLVTGAAGGIGRASAIALAAAGARVVVSDLAARSDDGQQTVKAIREGGGDAIFTACDVTSATDWQSLIAETLAWGGQLDFAHNNAGIGFPASLVDTTEEEFQRVLTVNTTSVWLGMKYQIPAMLAAGRGSIVNTSSLAGLRGLAHGSAYSASKHAVLGLTRSASNEYANDGVRVNAICPAAVDTNMTAALPAELRAQILVPQAMKRFAAPREIGYAVAWLCSDAASFITGVALPVDGGASAS